MTFIKKLLHLPFYYIVLHNVTLVSLEFYPLYHFYFLMMDRISFKSRPSSAPLEILQNEVTIVAMFAFSKILAESVERKCDLTDNSRSRINQNLKL